MPFPSLNNPLAHRGTGDVTRRQMVLNADWRDGSAESLGGDLRVFTTTPPSRGEDPKTYLQRVADAARWSEAAGCEGTLVYTDNSLVDPWLVSQAIIQSTERLSPLVAIQPPRW
jgi:hypothetical protein